MLSESCRLVIKLGALLKEVSTQIHCCIIAVGYCVLIVMCCCHNNEIHPMTSYRDCGKKKAAISELY